MNTRSLCRLLACCPLLFLTLGASADHAVAAEVEWRTDYGKARQEALDKGRPLVIDFATVNCYWCKQLEQRTFVDAAVVALLNEHCIPLHIDAARNPDLIEKMNIQNYPTLVYASPEGRILGYQEGFIEASVFRLQVQHAINAASTPEWMNRDFAEATKAAAQEELPRALAHVEEHHGGRQGTGGANKSTAAGSASGATSGGAIGRRQTASGQGRRHGSDEVGRRGDETICRRPAAPRGQGFGGDAYQPNPSWRPAAPGPRPRPADSGA